MTVEVSALDRRLVHPRRLLNPFSWMNPTRVAETVETLVPGLVRLVEEALEPARGGRPVPPVPPPFVVDLAAAK